MAAGRNHSSNRSNASGPPSPTMSAHTTATNIGLPSARLPAQLINRTDLRNSLSAYETLLTASKAYTQALIALGSASSELAVALETCSRLKGGHKVGSGLLAASGVHHMASNSWSILADTFWKDTSIPLMEHHDLYVQACTERTIQHEKAITQKSRLLNEAERRNQKESRSKVGRDLHSFRRALLELQKHVDDLDEEKARYYADVLEGEEECWTFVQEKVITSLRSQLDMFERISNKGMSDPVLEPLLSNIPDPFSAYGPPRNDDQIFSILNHGSLLGLSASPGLQEGSGDHTPRENGDHPSEAQPEPSALTPANLIMSPSTPSKGLSRVASGAASPKQNGGETQTTTNGTSSTSGESGQQAIVSTSSAGLGISLAAAVDLARQSKASPQTKVQTSNVISDNNAELFGTDGEDDGGDEASIFSGTEDDGEGLGLTDDKTGGKPSAGMAARIMQEKKRRRENAVRANAKTRLKHALSTIDESKGNTSQSGNSTLSPTTTNPSSDADKSKSQSAVLSERDVNTENSSSKDEPLEKKDGKGQSSSQNSNHVVQHDVDSVWT